MGGTKALQGICLSLVDTSKQYFKVVILIYTLTSDMRALASFPICFFQYCKF